MYSGVEDLVQQGLAHHRAGRLEEAKYFYIQALALDAQHADALHLAGLVALEGGKPQDAVELIRRASRRQPRNWMFHANLASALLVLKRHDEAFSALGAAVKLNPDEPQLQIGAANCLALNGDFAGAEARLRKVVRRFAYSALAWLNLANTVRDQNRLEEAAKLFTRAVQLDANYADAWNNLGSTLHKLQQFGEAEAAYRKTILLTPGNVVPYCNLASLLIDRGMFAEAETTARAALKIDAKYVTAHSMLATAVSGQGRLTEAVFAYRAAATLAPDDLRLRTALGSALFEAGNADEGIELLERVLTMQPAAPAVHQGLAWAYLASGRLKAGWREYAYRQPRERFVAKHVDLKLTTELPADLSGRKVCLLREQGLGDELFFARYAACLAARGASILYSTDARLAGMLRRNCVFARVVADNEPVPAADFHVLIGDLPLALSGQVNGQDVHDALPPPLELIACSAKLGTIRTRLASLGPPPYIGVTWRAGIAPEHHRGADWAFFKQVSLAFLAAALRGLEGTVLVLQRGPHADELKELCAGLGRVAHDLSDLNNDLEAMLALLTLIDDYVGVSNTNMHLRAGVGKTARVLVPCPAEWRWMPEGGRSRWFPGFHVYRQHNDGDWSEAWRKLREDLQSAYGALPGCR